MAIFQSPRPTPAGSKLRPNPAKSSNKVPSTLSPVLIIAPRRKWLRYYSKKLATPNLLRVVFLSTPKPYRKSLDNQLIPSKLSTVVLVSKFSIRYNTTNIISISMVYHLRCLIYFTKHIIQPSEFSQYDIYLHPSTP